MALRHQTNGEYEEAIAAYLSLLDDSPSPQEDNLARFHLAECYFLSKDYVAAAAAWEDFLVRYPSDARAPEATLMAARVYDADHNCEEAIAHYQTYLDQETILADMVYEWIGDCYASQAAVEEAISAYRQALDAARDPSIQASLREKIAGANVALGDYDAALDEYDAILRIARVDYYRAQIEYLAGQVRLATGQPELAHARFRRAMDRYPSTAYGYLSLVALVEAGLEVDELQRGLVDYYAGASYPSAFRAAIEAFDRYLSAEPATRADEALYHKALAQRALGDRDAALDTLETIILEHPLSKWLASAWLEKANTLAETGDTNRAVKAFQDVAAFFPADKLAPKALWMAAELREEEGDFSSAAQLYGEVQFSFPAFDDSDEALWNAGLLQYRAGASHQAVATWQTLLEKYPESPYRAKSWYWLGKLEATSGTQKGGDYWDQLLAGSPHGYYALRVRQVRSGESLSSTRLITSAIEPPAFDATEAETEILTWLGGWTEVPTDTQATALSQLPDTLADHVDLRRGEALLAAGLRQEALDAYGDLRSAMTNKPIALAQLAFYFQDKDLPAQAARCAFRLVELWPDGLIYDAPLSVRRLAYPLAYADLLSAQGQKRGLDPLLLAALVRQESYFEPLAESYAGARGLSQVMPATAEGIADNLLIDDFDLDDLYRPSVGIEFGAYYLATQIRYFDDQILVALAAYHGGPGNTLRWLEAGGGDLDLFVEVITATESRRYLQQVYQQYLTYEALYRPAGNGQ
jgi:soluble lytic murein transglycosylase